MNNCGLPDYWNTAQNIEHKQFTHILKQRLNDIYEQQIQADIDNNNSHCNYYTIIKQSPYTEYEKYITSLSAHESVSMCKLRCGNHKLPIIAGRYGNIDRDDRMCTLCTKNDVGDEFHYIFVCEHFREERKKYISHYFYNKPNTYKAYDLFNSSV